MSYLQSLSPRVIPANIDPNDHLKVWQERLLQSLFLGGAAFSLIFSILFASAAISNKDWTIIAGSLGFFVLCLAIFAMRKLSYWFRSILALVLIYIFSNTIYLSSGWTGISLILLLLFSFLCTTFLFQGPARIGFIISLATLFFWATLRLTNIISGAGLSSSINSLSVDLLIVLLAGVCVNFTISSLKSQYLRIYRQNLEMAEKEKELAEQVKDQTSALERRVIQLRTAAEINRTISSIQEPQLMIRQVTDSIKEKFNLYYVGIFLVDAQKEFAVLQYGTGEAGRRMMANRHRLAVGGYSMIGWTTQTRKPRIALDIGTEAVHFENPYLPDTHSELALPIATTTSIFGAMTVQSDRVGAFDENDIVVLQSIADSLAISLENNQSFKQTQKALEDIRVLNKAYVQQAWSEAVKSYGNLQASFDNPNIIAITSETKKVNVPLKLRDEVIGEITLDIEGDELTKEQLEFLDSVSTQTTMALENARLIDETQRAASKEQKLNELSSQFSRALTIEDILKTAVIEFGKLPSVSEASISLIPPEEMNLKPVLESRTR